MTGNRYFDARTFDHYSEIVKHDFGIVIESKIFQKFQIFQKVHMEFPRLLQKDDKFDFIVVLYLLVPDTLLFSQT